MRGLANTLLLLIIVGVIMGLMGKALLDEKIGDLNGLPPQILPDQSNPNTDGQEESSNAPGTGGAPVIAGDSPAGSSADWMKIISGITQSLDELIEKLAGMDSQVNGEISKLRLSIQLFELRFQEINASMDLIQSQVTQLKILVLILIGINILLVAVIVIQRLRKK